MTKPKIEKICRNCNKVYFVRPSRSDTIYCSAFCHYNAVKGSASPVWKGGPVKMACPQCGKSFVALRGDKRRKYCSKKCLDKVRMKRVNLICSNCGKEYIEKLSRSNRGVRSFCSMRCRDISMNGSGNHNWLGGISFVPYPITFNDKFKQMIRERDSYTCQICGKYGNLVHHINSVKDDTFPDNCIILCRSCHTKIHVNNEYRQSHTF